MIIFLFFITYSNILLSKESKLPFSIEYSKGTEFLILPYFTDEIGVKLRKHPVIFRGKYGISFISGFITTEVSFLKIINNQYDLFLAGGFHAIMSYGGIIAQIGVDVPRQKKGHYLRYGVSLGRYPDQVPNTKKYNYVPIPIVGFRYKY